MTETPPPVGFYRRRREPAKNALHEVPPPRPAGPEVEVPAKTTRPRFTTGSARTILGGTDARG